MKLYKGWDPFHIYEFTTTAKDEETAKYKIAKEIKRFSGDTRPIKKIAEEVHIRK